MESKKGQISVTTENIFPIIRQWLYEDQDIFVRELVSNCADAISKFKRLVELGNAEAPSEDEKYEIWVRYDDDTKIISFEDNGIGMTAEEVEKYINQIAFSGALDFVTKYSQESTDKTGIIGHFGLGFYSAFMVADKVTIETKSFTDSPAVKWESEDGMSFELSDCDKTGRGTLITLKLSEEAAKIFDSATLRMTLRKYCAFIPSDLYFVDLKADRLHEESEAKKRKEAEEKGEEYKSLPLQNAPMNNKEPLWIKKPSECTDEEYKSFYHSVFNDSSDPLFWIHLNMDYPFTLQGILYFPKTNNVYQSLEGRIKIYNHQVFVADNIEEIIPDFLFLLQGCLDCSDLPLNVSRSALQQDSYVKKLSGHIIKKVADRLCDLFKKDRESFEKYWSDISVFVKYGCMKDEKFYDKVKDVIVFKTVDGEFKTVAELTADDKKDIYYTNDAKAQAAYVDMCKNAGNTVVVMNEIIDNDFESFFEFKNQGYKFKRVDSEIQGSESDNETLETVRDLFRKALSDDKLDVKAVSMGDDQLPAMIRESEENRRIQEMRKQYEQMMGGSLNPDMNIDELYPDLKELVINIDNPIVAKIRALHSLGTKEEEVNRLALHIYDQARLAHGSIDSEALTRFLKYNSELLAKNAESL